MGVFGRFSRDHRNHIVDQLQSMFALPLTQASPEMQQATMKCDDGTILEHPIHYLEDTIEEVYEKFCEADGELCSLEYFRLQRPYFVRKPKWRHCLCPDCYKMRLLHDGWLTMVDQARMKTNLCKCDFCTFQQHEQHGPSVPAPAPAAALAPAAAPTSDQQPHVAMVCLHVIRLMVFKNTSRAAS